MQILYEDLPDDGWRRAGEVLADQWKGVFDDAAKLVVSPLRSPEGEIVPYVLQATTYGADGARDYTGAAIVWDGAVLNTQDTQAGRAVATRYLRALGFPGQRISLGHLHQILFLTHSIPGLWLTPPVPAGWDALDRKLPLRDEPLATLVYEHGGARLTLYRVWGSSASGGYTPPTTERLRVRFEADATFTMDAARQMSGAESWEPFLDAAQGDGAHARR